MAAEKIILKQCQLKASSIGWRLFRNNVSLVLSESGNPMRTGLCKGSSDLIGWRPVTITPDMVGKTIAQFVGCEVKSESGRVTVEQQSFLDAVNAAGGHGILARTPDDLT